MAFWETNIKKGCIKKNKVDDIFKILTIKKKMRKKNNIFKHLKIYKKWIQTPKSALWIQYIKQWNDVEDVRIMVAIVTLRKINPPTFLASNFFMKRNLVSKLCIPLIISHHKTQLYLIIYVCIFVILTKNITSSSTDEQWQRKPPSYGKCPK